MLAIVLGFAIRALGVTGRLRTGITGAIVAWQAAVEPEGAARAGGGAVARPADD